MIKLIVKYSFQMWGGSRYNTHERSIILSFSSASEISNQAIEANLKEKEDVSHVTVLDIKQIT